MQQRQFLLGQQRSWQQQPWQEQPQRQRVQLVQQVLRHWQVQPLENILKTYPDRAACPTHPKTRRVPQVAS